MNATTCLNQFHNSSRGKPPAKKNGKVYLKRSNAHSSIFISLAPPFWRGSGRSYGLRFGSLLHQDAHKVVEVIVRVRKEEDRRWTLKWHRYGVYREGDREGDEGRVS